MKQWLTGSLVYQNGEMVIEIQKNSLSKDLQLTRSRPSQEEIDKWPKMTCEACGQQFPAVIIGTTNVFPNHLCQNNKMFVPDLK